MRQPDIEIYLKDADVTYKDYRRLARRRRSGRMLGMEVQKGRYVPSARPATCL
jgi:hypothetical protein